MREQEQKCAQNMQITLPAVVVEAMAYVPFQQYETVYDAMEGFENGTIFPELNKPFLGADRRGMR